MKNTLVNENTSDDNQKTHELEIILIGNLLQGY